MYTKFLVLFVASIALCQVTKSFVIQDKQQVVNVTESAYVVFNSVSTTDDGVPSAIVIDDDEMASVQSVIEEKNETMYGKDDDKKFNIDVAIEQAAISVLEMKEEVQEIVNDDKNVEEAQSTVGYEETKVKNENSEEARTPSGDSDEEQKKFDFSKQFQPEEENDGEQEDDHESDE